MFDIFNTEKVEELTRKLVYVTEERDEYKKELELLRQKFEVFEKAMNKLPDDCEPGPWCKACAYMATIHYGNHFDYITYCRKGVNGCPNLILAGDYHTEEE